MPVADLWGGWWVQRSDRIPLRQKFFGFSQQKETENKLILPQIHLKTCIVSMIAPLSQNHRSATGIYMNCEMISNKNIYDYD